MYQDAIGRWPAKTALIAGFSAIALFGAVAASTPVIAAGGGTPKKCIKKDANGNCIKWQQSGVAPTGERKKWAAKVTGEEPERYLEAVWLAEAGKYSEALAKLESLNMPDNPNVLNYMGFTNRKLGNVDRGIKFYKQALAIDPRHVGANEYLGEAYLQKGDLTSAKSQLDKVEAICGGRDCDEYQDLAEEIRKYETENRG